MNHYPNVKSTRRAAEVLRQCTGVIARKVYKLKTRPGPHRWDLFDARTHQRKGHAELRADGLHLHGVTGPQIREHKRDRNQARTTVRLPSRDWWAILGCHGYFEGQIAELLRRVARGDGARPVMPLPGHDTRPRAVSLYDDQWRAILAQHGMDGCSIPDGVRTIVKRIRSDSGGL